MRRSAGGDSEELYTTKGYNKKSAQGASLIAQGLNQSGKLPLSPSKKGVMATGSKKKKGESAAMTKKRIGKDAKAAAKAKQNSKWFK
jgi:hypothetical protein